LPQRPLLSRIPVLTDPNVSPPDLAAEFDLIKVAYNDLSEPERGEAVALLKAAASKLVDHEVFLADFAARVHWAKTLPERSLPFGADHSWAR